MIFRSSRVVIAPSASVLAPMIRGEPDMEGLLLGSRELLCLSSRISRTLVSCSSLSELYLLGESVSCQMQGELWAGGVTSFYRLANVVADYQGTMPSLRLSVSKFLPSLIQPVPIPSTRFFFLFDYRICHCAHFDTSPPGAFGRNGFHGESA